MILLFGSCRQCGVREVRHLIVYFYKLAALFIITIMARADLNVKMR